LWAVRLETAARYLSQQLTNAAILFATTQAERADFRRRRCLKQR
jgi:hypothetical protein